MYEQMEIQGLKLSQRENEIRYRRVLLQNRMIFWKSSKGGGVIFNPKIYVADFGNFKQGFLSMKLIKRGVSSGYVFSTIVLILTDINWYYLAYASLHKCDHIHYNKIAP